MSGVRYIANKNHVRAIVAKLSNGQEGNLVQSPRNHPSQIESFKDLELSKVIRKVEVIYNEGNFNSSRRLSDSLNTVEEAVNCAGNSLSASTISSSVVNTNDS